MAFIFILERCVSPLIFYLGVAGMIASASSNLLARTVAGFLAVLCLRTVWFGLLEERKISLLGARAPALRSLTPWNLGTIIKGIVYFRKNQSAQFWFDRFSQTQADTTGAWTVEAIQAGQRVIMTSNSENIKAMMSSQFDAFGKGAQFRKEWKHFLGFSIFTTDGDTWHRSRQLLRPQFNKERIHDLHVFEHSAKELVPLLSGSGQPDTVDADDLFYRYTLNVATHFLLGRPVNCITQPREDLTWAFEELQSVQALRARAGPTLRDLIPSGGFDKAIGLLNDFVASYVDQALSIPVEDVESKSKSSEEYTFLHSLVAHTRDRTALRDQIAANLMASRDTTALTMTLMFYELSRHPEMAAKVRKEVLDTIGSHEMPTFTSLKQMKYLRNVMHECLRTYPPAAFNSRRALIDTTLPTGGGPNGKQRIGVPANTCVFFSPFVLQRRCDINNFEALGLPAVDVFAPERWETWKPQPWTYVPFNGGPRLCIGQQFAETEIAFLTARIFQTYERVECFVDGELELRSDIIMKAAKPVRLRFVRP